MLLSHDSGCDESLTCTTTAGDAAHSSTDSHPSGHAYPSPRASTDSGARYTGSTTLSSRDFGCDEFLACTITAGDATHSNTDSHSSEHVYFDTCSC